MVGLKYAQPPTKDSEVWFTDCNRNRKGVTLTLEG